MSHSHRKVHVALFPSAGMGHLTPFLRLAAVLLRRRLCRVTLITTHPTLSLSESLLISRFLSSFSSDQLTHLQFNLSDDLSPSSGDPFWVRFAAVRSSIQHHLGPLLRSITPLNALIFDVTLISPVLPIADSLSLPRYILFTSSSRMLSFVSHFPSLSLSDDLMNTDLPIPSLSPPIPRSSVPPMLLNPNSIFSDILNNDMPKLPCLNAILLNTFEPLEPSSLAPAPVHTLGPLEPGDFEGSEPVNTLFNWLEKQSDESVVYVSFGSRTATKKEHIREIGEGLVKSGFGFLWVVKEKEVDRDETETELEDVIGRDIWERMKQSGLVVKHWVDQTLIMKHRAVGGFVSHCGWNSVTEAAREGVRVLGWPQSGDQMINAEVVRESGIGIFGLKSEVKADEIAERIKEMMESEELRKRAAEMREAARKWVAGDGGGREEVIRRLVQEWSGNVMSCD